MFGNSLDNMLSQYRQNPSSNAPVGTSTPATPPPTSFFSAASPINAGGISTGSSPFGALIPDLSKATPDQLKYITDTLSNLTYSVNAGGYLTSGEANDPSSAYVRGYYGQNIGSDPNANRLASNVYDLIGSFPTRPVGTRALNALPGYTPSSGPSYNDKLGKPYGGPLTTPGWNG